MPRPPTRYVGGYPVYGGTFGDRGSVQTFDQRVATGSAGPYPGWNIYGSQPGSTSVMPPDASMSDPGGSQPVDAMGYPINPGFSSPPPPAPTPGPTVQINPDNPAMAATPGSSIPGYNYYDAGNGITYVYDSDWNYLYTDTGAPSQPTQPTSTISNPVNVSGQPVFNNPFAGMPITGAGPYPGGNQNPANPGYVAPGVGPQATPESGGFKIMGKTQGQMYL